MTLCMYRIVIGAFWVHRDVFVFLFLLLLRCICFFILIEVTFGFHMAKEFFEDNESRVERKKEGKEKVWRILEERLDWRKIFPFLV
jgi:hypothetical protein